jgi:hypothetical protein
MDVLREFKVQALYCAPLPYRERESILENGVIESAK